MLVLVYLFAYGFIRGLLTKSLTGKRRECLGEPLAAITVLFSFNDNICGILYKFRLFICFYGQGRFRNR